MDVPQPPGPEPLRAEPMRAETRTRLLPAESFQSDPCWLEQLAQQPPSLPAGERVGPYEVEGLLGRGGMAAVYRARDVDEGRAVALKVLDPRLAADSRSLRRFRQEARLAAQLRHPRIVSVLACGEDQGRAWLSMPLVAGPTLEQVVEREGPLAPARAVEIVLELARAVEAAHQQGVVHRDLKPGNVLLHPRDGPLLLDLGLAKDLTREASLTGTGDVLGTPVYVAPEVASGEGRPDHRVDVYGLGAVLQYALTGQTLYAGESALEVLRRVVRAAPPRLRQVDPGLPEELDLICAQALARHPEDRYPSAAALAEDLERFLRRTGVKARLPGLALRVARAARRRPRLAAAAALALVALLTAPLVVVSSAQRLARRQRATHALEMLATAERQAAAGEHRRAEQELQHAMLLAKGAFLEDPSDPQLRAALADIKRRRAAHAELIGHWELADELRVNLARLEGDDTPAGLETELTLPGAVRLRGLGPGERVVLRPWSAEGGLAPRLHARVVATDGPVALDPGSYLALHLDPAGAQRGAFLLVLDAARTHELDLTAATGRAPAPGLWRLPSPEELSQAGGGD